MTARHKNPRLVIAGGSGFLGYLLARHFAAREWEVTILSRHTPKDANKQNVGIRTLLWDGETVGAWAESLEGATALINLSGKSVNCRYNERNKAEIYRSRLRSTAAIGEAISRCAAPPPVWLNASSATIYRHAEDRPMDETTGELGTGFSVDVCQKWEQALADAPTPTTRKVALRLAMVMSAEPGGVLDYFLPVVRLGLGEAMAGGRQFVSWTHAQDFLRAIEWILEHPDLRGPVNIASPGPVTNTEFMREIRIAVGMPIGLPAARWMLEIGALLMGTETELLVKSRCVVPGKLLASGFTFQYPTWPEALRSLLAAR